VTELAPAWVNAGPDERVVLRTRTSWAWRLRVAAIYTLFGIVVFWTGRPTTAWGFVARPIESAILVALIGARLLPQQLVVTNQRILTTGISRRVREVRIRDVLEVTTFEDGLSRWLRSSALLVKGQGGRLGYVGTRQANVIRGAVQAGRPQPMAVRSRGWIGYAAVRAAVAVLLGSLLFGANHAAPPKHSAAADHTVGVTGVEPSPTAVMDRKTAADLVLNSYLLNLLGGDYQHAYNLLCAAGRERLDETEFAAYVGKHPVLHYDLPNSFLEAEQYVYIVYFDYTDHSFDTVRLTVVTQDDGLRVCDGPGLRQQN